MCPCLILGMRTIFEPRHDRSPFRIFCLVSSGCILSNWCIYSRRLVTLPSHWDTSPLKNHILNPLNSLPWLLRPFLLPISPGSSEGNHASSPWKFAYCCRTGCSSLWSYHWLPPFRHGITSSRQRVRWLWIAYHWSSCLQHKCHRGCSQILLIPGLLVTSCKTAVHCVGTCIDPSVTIRTVPFFFNITM